ncbi:hypothetical protein HK102_007965 [Quaeritorhiza haematococci]|nr:hypothetical protein HK102_007965 [Quaeritorhiza haematococci]
MYSPIVIRIEYSLRNPRAGVHFVLPDPHVVSNRYPHLYTQNHPGSARLWMPCVDAYQERCVWELQCTVPRTVKDALQASGDLLRFPEEEFDELPEMIVVASGELLEQFVPANAPNKKTFHYKLQTAACASSILLAVGPFEVVPIPGWERLISMKSHDVPVPDEDHLDAPHSSPTELSQDYGAGGYAFCLPGWEDDMQYTISFLGQSLDILEQYVGASYPFASFKLVFVEDAYNPVITGASIAIAR